jgi:hypothetical protein
VVPVICDRSTSIFHDDEGLAVLGRKVEHEELCMLGLAARYLPASLRERDRYLQVIWLLDWNLCAEMDPAEGCLALIVCGSPYHTLASRFAIVDFPLQLRPTHGPSNANNVIVQ